jgi:hypothetical protein
MAREGRGVAQCVGARPAGAAAALRHGDGLVALSLEPLEPLDGRGESGCEADGARPTDCAPVEAVRIIAVV